MSPSSESSSNIGTGAGEQTSPKHQLDTLPAELLKLIVVLVREQDGYLKDIVDTFETLGWESRVQGNGLNAFSSTCKRLRGAALPFMCEVFRSRHLTHPLFQLDALPPALLGGVRKINCSAITRETLASLVAGLSLLRNADAMDISSDTMSTLTQIPRPTATTKSDAANALAAIPSDIIENTFRRCRSRIDVSHDDLLETANIPKFVRLPALRSFEIGGWAQAILPLTEQMAPNVVDLRIDFGPSRLETLPAAFCLPHLRHLTVEMLWTAADLLHAFAKCDIVSLRWIERGDDEGVYIDEAETPTALTVPAVDELPASLRTITFEPDDGRLFEGLESGWSDDDIAALAAKCASRGIAFEVKPGSRIETEHRAITTMSRDCPADAKKVCEKKETSLRDLLDWATRRIRWLEQTGNIAGMRKMVEVLTELKQRQVLEEA
ncbi:hypothetical protein JCM10296v2_004665 [Rhodotorula toruloides]